MRGTPSFILPRGGKKLLMIKAKSKKIIKNWSIQKAEVISEAFHTINNAAESTDTVFLYII